MASQAPRQSNSKPKSRHRRLKNLVRPLCMQLEDRVTPALFNIQGPYSYSGLSNNGCVATADLNKDGFEDAILTDFGTGYGSPIDSGTPASKINILYGKSGGGFNNVQKDTGGKNVGFVCIADINGDGYPDAVVVNANQENTGSVSVFKNDGAGNLSLVGSPFSSWGNNACWVGLADMTGDGVLDVIVSNFGKDDGTGENVVGNNVTIFQGNSDAQGHGDFTFSGSPITTLAPEIQFVPISLAIADFDGDGIKDIVAVSPGVPSDYGQPYPDGSIYSFRGTGSGGFADPNIFDTGGVFPVNIQSGDLNGDSKPDLVIANAGDPNASPEFQNNAVGVLLNVGTPGNMDFGVTNSITANCHGTFAVAISDFDLDGKADIAAVNYGSELGSSPAAFVSVYMGNGSGSFSPGSPGTYDTNTHLGGGQYLAVGDFDANGTPDLIVAHASNLVGLLLNTSTAPGPAVTINQASGQADPTNGSSITFDVAFSTGVTGFDSASDVDLSGSTGGGSGLSASIAQVDSSHYTVTVTGMSGTGTVKATIPAGAATAISGGQSSQASTSTDNQVGYDYVAPTVTINQAAGQADPTTSSPINFAVVFSEPINAATFTGADISFTGSTVGGTLSASVTDSGNHTNFTVAVTGMNGAGTVVATIPADGVQDPAGNNNTASTSTDNTVTYGSGSTPSVTINQGSGQADPTNSSPISFDVHFSEPVTGFDGSDILFTGSTVQGTLSAGVSGSSPGQDYTVTVTGMVGTGTVVASIPANAAVNNIGTGNSASTSADNSVTFDGDPPSVTINQAVGQADPTNVSNIKFDVKFSEPVIGFDQNDISLAGSSVGGTLSIDVTGSLDTYTVTVTGMTTRGFVIASIPAGAAHDAVGNSSLASTSTDNSVEFLNTGTVGFTQAVYSAAEDDVNNETTYVTITVTRAGQTDGAVSIHYSTSDNTARTDGQANRGRADYTPTSGTLSWDDQEGGDKTFTIPILSDKVNEGKELINLTLDNPVGSPNLAATTATVAINPSDGQGPGKYLDDDGDKYRISLLGRTGSLVYYRTDPDGDGRGPIESIVLTDTLPDPLHPRAGLVIAVTKVKTSTDGGTVGLGSITGSGLRYITARKANLNLEGINLDGYLGSLLIGNIANGADITTGRTDNPRQKTRINALVIGDGTDINVGAGISALYTAQMGDGSVTAASIGTMVVRTSMASDITADSLGALTVRGDMAGDVNITGSVRNMFVRGNFTGDVNVGGVGVDPARKALSWFRVVGIVSDSDIMVMGNVGGVVVAPSATADYSPATPGPMFQPTTPDLRSQQQ